MQSSAVLDTNVLVSAALNPRGTPGRLFVAADEGRFQLIVSPKLLYELESVLTRPRIAKRGLAGNEPATMLAKIAAIGTMWLDPRRRAPLSDNPDDDYVLALAQISGATLVSGDYRIHRDHPEGLTVVSPDEFHEQLTEI